MFQVPRGDRRRGALCRALRRRRGVFLSSPYRDPSELGLTLSPYTQVCACCATVRIGRQSKRMMQWRRLGGAGYPEVMLKELGDRLPPPLPPPPPSGGLGAGCPWCSHLQPPDVRTCGSGGALWSPSSKTLGSIGSEGAEEAMEHFGWHWARADPIVVRECKGTDAKLWQPSGIEALMRLGGGGTTTTDDGKVFVNAVLCKEKAAQKGEVWEPFEIHQFFRDFASNRSARLKPCRLKDFPPEASLEGISPEHYNAFVDRLPFKGYTNPTTKGLNLLGYLPKERPPPDYGGWRTHTRLEHTHPTNHATNERRNERTNERTNESAGPKGYIATAGSDGVASATNLHLDMADAVNVLLWTKKKEKAAARWHIWERRDLEKLRHKLYHELRLGRNEHDPILEQETYLTDDQLQRIGLTCYTVEQHQDEAILIPAGCAHQVRTRTPTTHTHTRTMF